MAQKPTARGSGTETCTGTGKSRGVSRGEGDMLCPPVVSRARVIFVPTCGVQGEVMGAGRLVDLLRCLQSFLEMILAGAVVELRPRAITEDRKERELGGTRDT